MASLSTLLAITVFGCAASPEDTQREETSRSESQSLYSRGPLAMWSTHVVDVCDDGSHPERVAQAKQILASSWSHVSNVEFRWHSTCDYSLSVVPRSFVYVTFQDDFRGMTSYIGMPESRASRFDFYHPGVSYVTLIGNDSGQHFTYEVLHEFGHVLGFFHEQERPDNWDANGNPTRCDQLDDGRRAVYGGQYVTPYFDDDSVMNYCKGWPTQLSNGDIAGARAVYGFHPICFSWGGCEDRDASLAHADVVRATASVWWRNISLHVDLPDFMAWASIGNGDPGDEVWLDRSFDGGRTWDSKLGDAFIPGGARDGRTHMFWKDAPGNHGMLRACGKAGNRPEIACTQWVVP